jgi:hypothetical protein
VFILKELKVICFHTLLQVFILKGLGETGLCIVTLPQSARDVNSSVIPTAGVCEKSVDGLGLARGAWRETVVRDNTLKGTTGLDVCQ